VIGALCGIAIVVTAGYILRFLHNVFFGELDHRIEHHIEAEGPITIQEKAAGFILASILFVVGLYPRVMTELISSAVVPFVNTYYAP
jgi:NADH-quinone oxidoreductase subunit M